MPITVVTGGPSEGRDLSLFQNFTFNGLADTIADEIDDTTSEYNYQITNSILQAIRYVENENFYFNETRQFTFRTVDEQQRYGINTPSYVDPSTGIAEDLSFFKDIIRITDVFITYGPYVDNIKRKVEWIQPKEMEYFSDRAAARGIPTFYTIFEQQFVLYPIPSGGPFFTRLLVSPTKLSEIVDRDAPHPWFEHGFDMLKARAKYNLYKNYLKDAALAAEALNDFNDELANLRNTTSKIQADSNIGNVYPTYF